MAVSSLHFETADGQEYEIPVGIDGVGTISLSDAVNDKSNDATGRIAATPKAVALVNDKTDTVTNAVTLLQSTVSSVQTTATEAKNAAEQASSTASQAASTANTAKTTAESAASTANTAKSTANTAKTTAESAASTANTAKSTADTAKSTADTAKATADSASKIASTASSNATTAKNTANSAKTIAQNALATAESAGGVPTGTIVAYMGQDGEVPNGYLLCNGAKVSRTTYANLFAVIGTKFGTGDGSTTFTLPNLNNRFLEGTTSTPGTAIEAGLPNITGYFQNCGFKEASNSSASGCFSVTGVPFHMVKSDWTTRGDCARLIFDANDSNSTYTGSEVRPSSYTTQYLIKY